MTDQNQVASLRRANLQRWMEAQRLNQTDLAGKLGVGRAYVSLLFSPDRFFGEKAARSIETKLRMAPGFLDVSGGDLNAPAPWVSPQDITPGSMGLLPRFDVVLTEDGYGFAPSPLPPLAFDRDWLVSRRVTTCSNLGFCAVHGDAMEPYLFEGDMVLVDTGQTTVEDGVAYAILYGNSLRVRRLGRRFDGGLIIRCDSARYQEEVLSAEDARHVKVLGRVIYRAG